MDELRGTFKYSAFIPSHRFRYAPPAILDPPTPPFFLRQKKCHHRLKGGWMPRYDSQRVIKMDTARTELGWRLQMITL
jgi:hypothetical protein